MNCREFERIWNERLDARGAESNPLAQEQGVHATDCPACQRVDALYQTLSVAIRSLKSPATPTAGFSDRVLAAATRDEVPVIRFRYMPRVATLAAAATLVAAVGLGLRATIPVNPVRPHARKAGVAAVKAIDPNDLTDALAVASSATWDLAREASAPAARVGRQILIPTEPVGLSGLLPQADTPSPSAGVWESMGDRVNAGVRPLEGSARHAFGFLLGLPSEDDRTPTRPAEGA